MHPPRNAACGAGVSRPARVEPMEGDGGEQGGFAVHGIAAALDVPAAGAASAVLGKAAVQANEAAVGGVTTQGNAAEQGHAAVPVDGAEQGRAAALVEGAVPGMNSVLGNGAAHGDDAAQGGGATAAAALLVTLAQVAFPPPPTRPGARVEHLLVTEPGTLLATVAAQLRLPEARPAAMIVLCCTHPRHCAPVDSTAPSVLNHIFVLRFGPAH